MSTGRVRNFQMRNGRRFMPERCWKNKAGPLSSSLIRIDIIANGRSNMIIPTKDARMSKNLLKNERYMLRVNDFAGLGREILTNNLAENGCNAY